MDTVALAPGEPAHLLLLVGPLEVEAGHVGPSVDLATSDEQAIDTSGYLLVDRALGIEGVAGLVDVGQLDRGADGEGAGAGRLLTRDHAEEGGLARAVGADGGDYPASGEREGEVVDQQALAVTLG